MAAIDDIFKSIPAQVLSQFGQNITYIKTTTPRTYNPTTGAITGSDTNVTVKGIISALNSNESEGVYQGTDGNFSEVKLGDIEVKYNTASQGTGSVNNILDVYPWLQSYLGAYILGGAGSFQMRVVRG